MTRRLHHLLMPVLLGAAACGTETAGVQVLVPGDVEFTWNDAYNDSDDGLTAVLPLDVLVYDAATGEGLADVELELASDDVFFVAADRVASGDEGCDLCLWDAYRDEYVDVDLDALDVPLWVRTDARGLARVYAVVDSLVVDDRGFLPATVAVTLGDEERTLRLLPR